MPSSLLSLFVGAGPKNLEPWMMSAIKEDLKLLENQLLGHSSNQTHTNLRGSATCLLHGATGLY